MDVTEKLKMLGLGGQDARVYAALLRAEWLPVRDIAETADLPMTNVYPALDRLRRRGMVTVNRNRVKHYSALVPSDAFKQLLEDEQTLIQRKSALLKELDEIHEKRQSSEHTPETIEVLGTDPVAFGAVRKRIREARREVLITNAFSYRKWTQADIRKVDSGEHEVLKRGVKVRCIYSPSQLALEFERGRMKGNVRAGEEARVSDKIPMNIAVVDDDMAVFSLPDNTSKHKYTVFRANERQMVMSLRMLFEHLWQDAEELVLKEKKTGNKKPTKTIKKRK